MQTIDVEQIDGTVSKTGQSLMEEALLQMREIAIQGIMMPAQIGQHSRTVGTGMRIAGPRIDGHAIGRDAQILDRLTECAVRHALARSKLDNGGGPQDVHQIHAERHMEAPRRKHQSTGS